MGILQNMDPELKAQRAREREEVRRQAAAKRAEQEAAEAKERQRMQQKVAKERSGMDRERPNRANPPLLKEYERPPPRRSTPSANQQVKSIAKDHLRSAGNNRSREPVTRES